MVVAHWAEPTQEALDTGMYYQDTTWYHMSFSGRFAQTGEVGPLHLTDPLKLTAWYYPQNSELLHAVPMVALDNDFLSPLINLGWLAVALLAAFCIGRPYAVGAATLLGAAVVLDSEMLVGSQAGNAPNDIAGIFFLLCVHRVPRQRRGDRAGGAPDSRRRRRLRQGSGRAAQGRATAGPGFDPEADEEHPQEGVVTDVPVAGDPRVLAGVGSGPLLLAGLAAGLGIGTKITLLAALGFLTIGIAYLGGREGWWKALVLLARRHARHGGLLVRAQPLATRSTRSRRSRRSARSTCPGPSRAASTRASPTASASTTTTPAVWKGYFFPPLKDGLGPLWPLIFAVAGRRAGLRPLEGRQQADAGARGDRDLRRRSPTSSRR